jgi:two-component system nitrate/nitrite sensor histidine kinase NarX
MHQTAVAPTEPTASTLLAEIAADVAAGEDLRELLGHFLASILRIAGARAGVVRMLDARGENLELVAALGLPGSTADGERVVDRRCGFCGQSASEHRISWARDLRGCARPGGDSFFGDTCRRGLAVPLEWKGRLLGIYTLFFEDGEATAPATLALLRGIGEMLGLALENHRLEAENLRETVSRERQLMAAEIHDAVAQNLTFVKMRLPLLRDAVEAGDKAAALTYLDDVRETLGQAHGCLREIITQFRTRADPRGLVHALLLLGTHFRARTGLVLRVESPLPELALDEQGRADLYRIVQEALANIEHHARARHAWLSLRSGGGQVELRVEDDGVGLDAGGARETSHWGCQIMRERAQRLGGELHLEARSGGGTVVRCVFPLTAGEEP